MNKLVNKSYKDYTYVSRYTSTPYYYNTEDEKYIYGISSYLDNTTIYTLHTVRKGETYDSLALDYYNNPTLYWIICSYNRIQNPFKEPIEGSKLKIPSISTIRFNHRGRS